MSDEHLAGAAQFRLRRALERSTVGFMEDMEARRRMDADVAGGDMQQRLTVIVNGKVGKDPIWQELTVNFPNPFLTRIAQGQTDSSLDDPHFTTGVELVTDRHIIIDAQVRDWLTNDSLLVTGCIVRVSAWSPTAGKKYDYSAKVHMSFTGYASPQDDDAADN